MGACAAQHGRHRRMGEAASLRHQFNGRPLASGRPLSGVGAERDPSKSVSSGGPSQSDGPRACPAEGGAHIALAHGRPRSGRLVFQPDAGNGPPSEPSRRGAARSKARQGREGWRAPGGVGSTEHGVPGQGRLCVAPPDLGSALQWHPQARPPRSAGDPPRRGGRDAPGAEQGWGGGHAPSRSWGRGQNLVSSRPVPPNPDFDKTHKRNAPPPQGGGPPWGASDGESSRRPHKSGRQA
jgi:hypothetical protein